MRLKRAKHCADVARGVIVHHGKHDGMHERNHVLGAVGRDAQQDVGAKHVKQENQINEAGKVEHCLSLCYMQIKKTDCLIYLVLNANQL